MTRSRIIGIRHHAQPRRRQVLFVGVLQIRHQLGRLAQAQHQHPGGHRVQRTSVTHALFAGGPAHLRHHVKRSQTLRLIEDKDTVHMRRTVAAASWLSPREFARLKSQALTAAALFVITAAADVDATDPKLHPADLY